MRYFYEKSTDYYPEYGELYMCDHPIYSCGTLFKVNSRGLVVIQQRHSQDEKTTWWTNIDPWIASDLYRHPYFYEYFNRRSGTCTDGLYPTVTLRQIMWALKMKPLKKEVWEI